MSLQRRCLAVLFAVLGHLDALARLFLCLVHCLARLVVEFVEAPVAERADAKRRMQIRFVPEHAIGNVFRFANIVDHNALEIALCDFHYLFKDFKRAARAADVLEEFLAHFATVFAQQEPVLDLLAARDRQIDDVLARNDREEHAVPAIFEEILYRRDAEFLALAKAVFKVGADARIL